MTEAPAKKPRKAPTKRKPKAKPETPQVYRLMLGVSHRAMAFSIPGIIGIEKPF